jgi:osmotically-inducible protein OsmY
MSTDTRLRHDIETALDCCAATDSHRIRVAVRDGIVLLDGQVGSYPERRAAEETAQSVACVKAVANDITVEPPFGTQHSDADIAAAAVDALKTTTSGPADRVKVVVRDGCLELQGQVDSWDHRSAAETAVLSLHGVKCLINSIFVRSQLEAEGSLPATQAQR